MRSDSDEHLVRYLLGDLPADEAESLDERSIADDSIAARLRVLEDELVDRYARGERIEGLLERLDTARRTSPYLQEKIRFAEALHARAASSEVNTAPRPIVPPRRGPAWSFAAAAALVLAAAGYLFIANQQLQSEINRRDARRVAVEAQNTELQQQLDDRRVQSAQPPAVTATYLLVAPRRSASPDTTVALGKGTAQVVLNLQVESADYATFWTALRDSENDQVVWRSADLPSLINGPNRIVTINVPVTVLRPQRYAVELSGLAGGTAELLAAYPIRVVLE
jgi:hypothetical protein